MSSVPAPATPGKVIAGAGTVCMCGDDERQHRTVVRGGQVTRGGCRSCRCDEYAAAVSDDLPPAVDVDQLDPTCVCGARRSEHRSVGHSIQCARTRCRSYAATCNVHIGHPAPDPADPPRVDECGVGVAEAVAGPGGEPATATQPEGAALGVTDEDRADPDKMIGDARDGLRRVLPVWFGDSQLPARPDDVPTHTDSTSAPGGANTLIARWRSWWCDSCDGYGDTSTCCGKPAEPVRVEIHRPVTT